ncbi:hypothetical protein B0A48_16082 [Cryoendolithus antarcticus]|uniref:Bromo domain-containing protein n=1 Tax=Cryoendolithus antarcticus TaxID=1507870 RepID=A0A1V8SFZ3_9PEZI|nr:hypothetical protein B0A48_16082 [Cryoendolithus antarcticus]
MESRKRKASNATPNDGATKRIRLVNSKHTTASPAPSSDTAAIQQIGQQLVNQIKRSNDKTTGHPISTLFLTLPSRKDLPDYYTFTRLPIAIDTIERKLASNAYSTVTEIESDFKRMVQNAKDYNEQASRAFSDAEKIRKLVFNYMKIHNPAYREVEGYVSFPTPLPGKDAEGGAQANGARSETPAKRGKASATPAVEESKPAASASAEVEENQSGLDFAGKTFQQAQQMIIDELLSYTDDEGLEIYTPFAMLPSRKLEDYYKFIKYPVSLKGVAKRIRGQHGRNDPTGITDFKSWDKFGEEMAFIWKNARDYNEDGSEMYLLANDFEEHFNELLEDVRSKVDEPSQPKLKLGGPKPKVTLSLSGNKPPPAPGAVSVDSEALARQRQMVSAGADGYATQQRPQYGVNGTSHSNSNVPTLDPRRSHTAGSHRSPEPVKLESRPSQSPALNAVHPSLTNGTMPPPSFRPNSSSPHPTQLPTSYHYTAPTVLPPTPVRTYPLENALIPLITLKTHPHLKLPSPFHLEISPHPTLATQSRTLTLMHTHYFLQISPTISRRLSSGTPYKCFVTVNGTRLTQRDTVVESGEVGQGIGGLRRHVYEGSLAQGVNRVEVEVAAARGEGKEGLDVERFVGFVNLMRA